MRSSIIATERLPEKLMELQDALFAVEFPFHALPCSFRPLKSGFRLQQCPGYGLRHCRRVLRRNQEARFAVDYQFGNG